MVFSFFDPTERRMMKEAQQRLDMQLAQKHIAKTRCEADKYIERFTNLARESREYGDMETYNTAFRAIDQTLKMKKGCIQQALHLEIAGLSLSRANSVRSFADAITKTSDMIGSISKNLNIARVSAKAQIAGAKIVQMQEQVDMMMDIAFNTDMGGEISHTTREEIESLINGADKVSSQAHTAELKGMLDSIAEMRQSIKKQQ